MRISFQAPGNVRVKEDNSENTLGWWRGNIRADYNNGSSSNSVTRTVMLGLQYNPLLYLHFFVFGMLLAFLRKHLVAAAASSCQPPDAFSALRKRMMLAVWDYGKHARPSPPPYRVLSGQLSGGSDDSPCVCGQLCTDMGGSVQLDLFTLPLTHGAPRVSDAQARR